MRRLYRASAPESEVPRTQACRPLPPASPAEVCSGASPDLELSFLLSAGRLFLFPHLVADEVEQAGTLQDFLLHLLDEAEVMQSNVQLVQRLMR